MAAGTGGHVFPALSIAKHLTEKGADVHWLVTHSGMENKLLSGVSYPLHKIQVSGLRGSGIRRLVLAPIMLIRAFFQSAKIIRSIKPDCVLGMGGFVCGPAGLAAKCFGVPLLIHEQNAVAGLTNKILSKFANKTFAAFPGTFPGHARVEVTGNPVRQEIEALREDSRRDDSVEVTLRVLVLGGSQGAAAINRELPKIAAHWKGSNLEIWHQTGAKNFDDTKALYEQEHESVESVANAESHRVSAFIENMGEAYRWADIVICRSGASTVSELAVVGLPAILVPYPYHKDQQQLHNANWLVNEQAALLVEQNDFTASHVLSVLEDLAADRSKLTEMRRKSLAMGKLNAAKHVADRCLEIANEQ